MATATITLADLENGEVSINVSFGGASADPANSDAHAMALEMIGSIRDSGEVTSAEVRRLSAEG